MKPSPEDLESRVQQLEQEVASLRRGGRRRKRTVRYRSAAHILGCPLLCIATGPCPELGESVGHARGVLAIGDVATGVIAIGGIARGGLAIGGVSVGLFSLGGVAVGLLAGAGGVATGLVAAGGLAIGGLVAGGAAVGWWPVGGGVLRIPDLLETFLGR
ncbi:hypothetical protein Psta_2346 [Pirellula staleyi DSM 6068]|uniref:Uncharacterized protein n=1 Tax=Pirellula staleyi (strain ATCC 27377 / DSM 6068 / ICPB 4128) TaxID=530564 RepID=D2R3R2_PIRSD|nr:hypothetical protein [Pirellula staleyi]ADB17016.1 hypothetical protein Psta_2346 [Pirellula staleyi DSM 6068]